MKEHLVVSALALASLGLSLVCGLPLKSGDNGEIQRVLQVVDGELTCHISMVDTLEMDDDGSIQSADQFFCTPIHNGEKSVYYYVIDLPVTIIDLFQDHLSSSQFDDFCISVPGGLEDDSSATILVPNPSAIQTKNCPESTRRRRLAATRGNLTAMVIRIVASGRAPSSSAAELKAKIFEDDVSMRNQFYLCSQGDFGIDIKEEGVLDVFIDHNVVAEPNRNAVLNKARDAALNIFRARDSSVRSLEDYADLFLYMMPRTGNFLAYAFVNGIASIYNEGWQTYITIQMHEVGHNLGLRHSHEKGQVYQDMSGYMGGVLQGFHNRENFPSMCYNGADLWSLNWFQSNRRRLNSDDVEVVSLAAFTDVDKAERGVDNVLLRFEDYCIHLNSAKKYNVDTYEFRDRLVITRIEDRATHHIGSIPNQKGAIYVDEHNGEILVIEVCETLPETETDPEIMIISVGYSDTLCSLHAPTIAPTYLPTSLPTSRPTWSPTLAPSHSPSSTPSFLPTVRPTNTPSLVPTKIPSYLPTSAPTSRPSISPSMLPTTVPTVSPSSTPTLNPSSLPSIIPTSRPSVVPTATPSWAPSSTPTLYPSGVPTAAPSSPPSGVPSLSPSVVPTLRPSSAPSLAPSIRPSAIPSSKPSTRPSAIPSFSPSIRPSDIPSFPPSVRPSFGPTQSPSGRPTGILNGIPGLHPNVDAEFETVPTSIPANDDLLVGPDSESGSSSDGNYDFDDPSIDSHAADFGTIMPSALPPHASEPSPSIPPISSDELPTNSPSLVPTWGPTVIPTFGPTRLPTEGPTWIPTDGPTLPPTWGPTVSPTMGPTYLPTLMPTSIPTDGPTLPPSWTPTYLPTIGPTHLPTNGPTQSLHPTLAPTDGPTMFPTVGPTSEPTRNCARAGEFCEEKEDCCDSDGKCKKDKERDDDRRVCQSKRQMRARGRRS